jgi:hypothetical protein
LRRAGREFLAAGDVPISGIVMPNLGISQVTGEKTGLTDGGKENRIGSVCHGIPV